MALILEANYSKKIGLPGYSSHQFSLTLKTEVSDPSQIGAESTRLYTLLQSSVDHSMQQVGWMPDCKPANGNGNGHNNGRSHAEKWNCSDKQRDLIQKITDENRLDKNQIEQLAQDRFGKSVRQLNKLEASGLIDELFAQYGGKHGPGGQRARFNGRINPAPR